MEKLCKPNFMTHVELKHLADKEANNSMCRKAELNNNSCESKETEMQRVAEIIIHVNVKK